MDSYTGHREVFSCDFGPRIGEENISDIEQCSELFFDKEIIQQIVRHTNRYAEQYKNARGNLLSFRSFVRSWTPVTESESAQSTENRNILVYCCQICDVGLCLEDFFELYHT